MRTCRPGNDLGDAWEALAELAVDDPPPTIHSPISSPRGRSYTKSLPPRSANSSLLQRN
ncbi:hypothetical protein [Nocardia sp. NPDC005998]|uniref:hypothetical protein n=1 Tax=Nocardia sp. NPDC005998 TaxID=3156894 RepID=UPI0033B8086C